MLRFFATLVLESSLVAGKLVVFSIWVFIIWVFIIWVVSIWVVSIGRRSRSVCMNEVLCFLEILVPESSLVVGELVVDSIWVVSIWVVSIWVVSIWVVSSRRSRSVYINELLRFLATLVPESSLVAG